MGRKKNKSTNKGVFVQAGITAVILFIVVMILVGRFTVSCEEGAEGVTYNLLMSEASSNAAKLGGNLESVMRVGEGFAAVIEAEASLSDDDETSIDTLKEYAAQLVGKVDNVYLVLVVDANGKGIASTGADVDISGRDYYKKGAAKQYLYTENDGITQRSAFVALVPYYIGEKVAGYVYVFADPDAILSYLPVDSYGGGVSFAVVETDGTIVTRTGHNSSFTSGTNIFDNINGSQLLDLSLSQIKLHIEKKDKMAFAAVTRQEARTITSADTGVGDWQLVTALNQQYVDLVMGNMLRDGKVLVTELAVITLVFIFTLIAMLVVSRVKYGAESNQSTEE